MPLCAFGAGAFDQGTSTEGVEQAAPSSNAGNAFLSNISVKNSSFERDFYWAGQVLDAQKITVGTSGHGSLLAAGQQVMINTATVEDSLRIAAQTISIMNTKANNNITVAAENISLGNEVEANGVYAAGKNLNIAGSYQGGMLFGESVNVSGTFKGDLNIGAANITIDKGAKVEGTLTLPDGAAITIDEGAQVPNVTYQQTFVNGEAESTVGDWLLSLLYAVMAHILLAGLYLVIIRNSLNRAADMTRKKFGSMLLSGLLVFLLAPFVVLLLLFPLVTIPIAVLLVFIMVIIALFSIPFTGSAIGLSILGDKINPVGAAVLGTVILTVFVYVPIVQIVAVLFSIIYTCGYIWQHYRQISKKHKQEALESRRKEMQGVGGYDAGYGQAPQGGAGRSTVPPQQPPYDGNPTPPQPPQGESTVPPQSPYGNGSADGATPGGSQPPAPDPRDRRG